MTSAYEHMTIEVVELYHYKNLILLELNIFGRGWGQGEGSFLLSDKLKYNIFYANGKFPVGGKKVMMEEKKGRTPGFWSNV